MIRSPLFIALACWALPLAAAPAPAPPLTLASVLAAVRAHDPSVAAGWADAAQARGQALSAYAWDAPQLGLQWMGTAWPNPNLNQSQSRELSLTQSLPFPGRTWLAGRAASHSADAAQDEAGDMELEELERASAAYYDLAAADYLLGALTRTAEATRSMAALSAQRGAFGQLDRMGQFMDTMLKLTAANVDTALSDAWQQRVEAEARLDRLMGDADDAPLPPTSLDVEALLAAPIPELAKFWRRVEAHNLDLAGAQARQAAARSTRAVAWSGWLPDLTLQGSVTQDDQGGRQGGAMLGLSLPWLWGWKQAGQVAAADAAADQASLALEAERLDLRRDARTALGELEAARAGLRIAWTRARPQAEQGLAQARQGFRSAALGPTEILMALQSYQATQQGVAQALARLGRAQAALDTLTGGPVTGTVQGDKP